MKVASVRLNVDGGGSVSIEGKATVEYASVEVTYRGEQPERPTYSVEDGVLTLNGCGPRCAADYTVIVPKDIPVTGEAGNDAVALTQVSGINVTTDNGEISLTRIESGGVAVRSDNGTIRGVALFTDRVNAETKNGEIEIQVAKPQSVRAQTVDGAVRLIVPEEKYRVWVETVNGPLDLDVENNPEGVHHLDLRTRNGAITVRTT